MPPPVAPRSSRPGRAEDAYRRIRQFILAGRLSPGARLVETDLAGRLGVSRGAIRPALLRLQQEGLVQDPGHGKQARLIVAPLTQPDAEELYLLVGQIEGLAAARVARLPAERLEPVLEGLRSAQADMAEAARSSDEDGEAFLEHDRRFHQAIVDAAREAGGVRMVALLETLRPQLDRYARLYAIHGQERFEAALEEHRAILASLGGRDPEGSQEAVRVNWRNGAQRLVQVMERLGERGDWPTSG